MLSVIKVKCIFFILWANISISYQEWNLTHLENFKTGTFIPKAGCEDNRNVEYVCDKDKNFPSTKMRKIIENLKYEHRVALKAFSKEYRPKRIPSPFIIGTGKGSPAGVKVIVGREVCPFNQQIHYPQKARNKYDKWRYQLKHF